MTDTFSADPIALSLRAALADVPVRVRALLLADGQRVWLKRAEQLGGLLRLQKGNGIASFERERDGLRHLAGLGLPVAPILAEGEDWFVTPDLGETLRSLLWNGATTELSLAFAAAGTALGQLHSRGLRHGRPAIRDICWDGRAARFIDLERFTPGPHSRRARAVDLLIFVHSMIADGINPASQTGTYQVQMIAALDAYRRACPEVWQTASRMARWLRPVAGLAALRPKSREARAIGPTLDLLRHG